MTSPGGDLALEVALVLAKHRRYCLQKRLSSTISPLECSRTGSSTTFARRIGVHGGCFDPLRAP